MKNKHVETLRRQAHQDHRNNGCEWGRGRVLTMHEFEPERLLTWWDDVSFVLNKRRVMVWWVHPRTKYSDEISNAAWKLVGDPPESDDDLFNGKTIYKPIGRSRKRILAYESSPTPPAQSAYYDKLFEIERQMQLEGIDHTVTPAMSITHLRWCTGVDLCVPAEIRCQTDAVVLAALVRRLLTRETTLAVEFPGYAYGRAEWLSEANAQEEDNVRRREVD